MGRHVRGVERPERKEDAMSESTWREGQFDAVRHGEGVASARGRLAQICSYGNIYANGCDIVDALLDPENRELLLAAEAEADEESEREDWYRQIREAARLSEEASQMLRSEAVQRGWVGTDRSIYQRLADEAARERDA